MSIAVLTLSLVKQGLLGLIVSSFGLALGVILFFSLKRIVITTTIKRTI